MMPWIRIKTEVYPLSRISSLRGMIEGAVDAFDDHGLLLTQDETTVADIGEHETLAEALAAAAAWDEADPFRGPTWDDEPTPSPAASPSPPAQPGDRRP
jgi:hypothetical protein